MPGASRLAMPTATAPHTTALYSTVTHWSTHLLLASFPNRASLTRFSRCGEVGGTGEHAPFMLAVSWLEQRPAASGQRPVARGLRSGHNTAPVCTCTYSNGKYSSVSPVIVHRMGVPSRSNTRQQYFRGLYIQHGVLGPSPGTDTARCTGRLLHLLI